MLRFQLVASLVCVCLGKMNIIFLLADDLGYGEPGRWPANSSHGRIATPNIDDLVDSGMRFSNAYAGYTVCAPSRTTLMTGLHTGHVEPPLTDHYSNRTVAALLRDLGYDTALVGKWGMGNMGDAGYPLNQGFNTFYGQSNQENCHNMYPTFVEDMGNFVNLTANENPKRGRDECMAHPELFNYTIDLFFDRATDYITERSQKKDQPFFLYLTPTVPHAGGWDSKGTEAGQPVPSDMQYAKKDWPTVERDHAASVSYLDQHIGKFLGKVKSLGLEDDTVVFFASDNGAHNEGGHSYLFFDSSGPLTGYKRSLNEGGVRSPSAVRWPGVTKPKSESDFAWAFWA